MASKQELVAVQQAILGVANEQASILQQIAKGMSEAMDKMYKEMKARNKELEKAKLNMSTTSYEPSIPSKETIKALNEIRKEAVLQNQKLENIRKKLSLFSEQPNQSPQELLKSSAAIQRSLDEVRSENAKLHQMQDRFLSLMTKQTMKNGLAAENPELGLTHSKEQLQTIVNGVDDKLEALNILNAGFKVQLNAAIQQEKSAKAGPSPSEQGTAEADEQKSRGMKLK